MSDVLTAGRVDPRQSGTFTLRIDMHNLQPDLESAFAFHHDCSCRLAVPFTQEAETTRGVVFIRLIRDGPLAPRDLQNL